MEKKHLVKYGSKDHPKLNSLSEVYDKNSQDFIINNIDSKTIKKILDIGCGHGSMSHFFAHKFPKAKVFSIDISQDQLEITKKRTHGKKNIQYFQLDIEHHNIDPEILNQLKSTDLIYVRYLLLHLKNWEIFFKNIYQLLKTGAKLIIEEPGFPWTTYPYSEVLQSSALASQDFLHSLGYKFDCIPHLWDWLNNQNQFQIDDVEFSHPTLKTYQQKKLMWMYFAQIKDPLIAAKVYHEEEFNQILDELKMIASDDKYIAIPLRLIQISLIK
ncbi:MAG: class I SAM-dependent methyltransferase [Spiroplasma sp.]|nr:class I SAM-dependent methyltransferase [Spiroplasma sp.]